MRKTTILLVGIGGFGQFYIRELLYSARAKVFQVAGAVDPYAGTGETARELRDRGIPIFHTLEEFYRTHRAELAILVTPVYLHAQQARYCMEQGSDVLCEKLICACPEDARIMIEARNRTGRKLAIGFQWSFDEAVLRLKQDILEGRYGRIRRMRTIVCFPRGLEYYRRSTGWAGKRRLDTGEWILDSVASNAAAHYLHNMLFLCGGQIVQSAEPQKIEAEVYRANPIDMFDTCALRVDTAEGAELLFYATHAVSQVQARDPEFVLEGEKGTVILEYEEGQGAMRGCLTDGKIINYGMPGRDGMGKLYCMERAIRKEEPLSCVAETTLPHLKCIWGLNESFPETSRFPEGYIDYDEEAVQYTCKGLGEALDHCWRNGSLPYEEKIAWARKSHEILF
nr:Gfo/Idh/MocA family oxidoreductase [uncultured Acetatifactor sp.]